MLVVRQVPVPLPTLACLGPARPALLLLIQSLLRLPTLFTLLQDVILHAMPLTGKNLVQNAYPLHVLLLSPILF